MPVNEDFICRSNDVPNETLHVVGLADELIVVNKLVETIIEVAFDVGQRRDPSTTRPPVLDDTERPRNASTSA